MRRLLLLCMLSGMQAGAQPAMDAAARRGQDQFTRTCSFCHGADATGGAEGPNLLRSGLVRHDENGNLIGSVIREGRPTKGMPAFPLSDAVIGEVVAYLHWRVTEADLRSPERPTDYSLKLMLTGDAGKGKRYFVQHCAECHSPGGDLKGVASRYAPADLQEKFLYPGDVTKSVVVYEKQGATFTGSLIYIDQFTVDIQDRDGWHHSWPAEQVRTEVNDPLAGHEALLAMYQESNIHDLFAYLETLK